VLACSGCERLRAGVPTRFRADEEAETGPDYAINGGFSDVRWQAVINRRQTRPGAASRDGQNLEAGVGDHPVLGYLIWAVLFGAVFAWEGLALSHISGSVPTLSATFRAIMKYPPGRWALFALWLWLGWHLFIRGWHFLLRA
jgi:hypothetical protein